VPLIDPATQLPPAQLFELRAGLIAELREAPEMLSDAPSATEAGTARGDTARRLVLDALAWVDRAPVPDDLSRLVAEINLLYDVSIVAAEYYKLFVSVPTPDRPAGRI
jgi:hypothetical protein